MPPAPSFLQRLYRRLSVVQATEAAGATSLLVRLEQERFVQQLLRDPRYTNSKRLNRFEHQVFSQNGEDGVIQEIFRRIGTAERTFVEVGAGDGQRNNTTFLLTQGWRGHWIEGNPALVTRIRAGLRDPLSEGRLTILEAVMTRENARQTMIELGAGHTPDLLSVDVDRNTYWVLMELLPLVRPRVAVIEYNALFPPDVEWTVAYDPERWWNRTSYYGASLKAYERLCSQHGMALVGCELHGVNAFFVRQDLCADHFDAPFTAEHHYEPARHFLVRTQAYPPCFSDLQ